MEKLGEGGEAEVFAIDSGRVLRRFRRADHPAVAAQLELIAEIAAGAGGLDVEVPEVLDHFVDDEGRPCFVERRLPGRSMTDALRDVSGFQRLQLLESYLTTARSLRRIEFHRPYFGELIAEAPVRTEHWSDYLTGALDRQRTHGDPGAHPEIADLATTLDDVRHRVEGLADPEPALVHFDYFPGNVLCDGWRITAVIDWSVLAIVGDPDLDVAMAVAYLGVTDTAGDDDVAFGWSWLDELGISATAASFERWAAAWWSPLTDDPTIRTWVASVLARDRRHDGG